MTMMDDTIDQRHDGGVDGEERVGDTDREHVVNRLQVHFGAGRLTIDEFLTRSDEARAALTRAELAVPLRDLPADTEPPPAGHRDPGWRTHALVATVTIGAVVGLWEITRDHTPAPKDYGADYWWPLWFGFFWGLAVLLHYLRADGRLGRPGGRELDWREPGGREPDGREPDGREPGVGALPEPSAEVADPPDAANALDALTHREREVLALVAAGCANKEIARRLFISERTARTHVSSILHKLELPSRTQAALVAVRAGLTGPLPDPGTEPPD